MTDSTFLKLYSYIRDFGFNRDDVVECLNKTSTRHKYKIENVLSIILDHILDIQDKCINQAAEHDKKLKGYQEIAVRHMLTHRGMIAAFDVGTGKTLTAVTVASCILSLASFLHRDIKVIIVTPTSLLDNFKREMINYGSNINDPRYHFYTTTKFGKDYRNGLIDCSKTLLIIDEAHNFRTDYRQIFTERFMGEKVGTWAEQAVKCGSNVWKVLLLTATPMYNKSHDIVNLVSIVKGIYPPVTFSPKEILNTNAFEDFFKNTIMFQSGNEEDYPTQINILVKVHMTREYLKKYEKEEDIVKKRIKTPNKDEKAKNAFQVKMRTASNKIQPCLKCHGIMGIVKYAFENNEKLIFYSEFRNSGVKIFIDLLNKNNINYLEITGSTDKKKRQKIVDDFNNQEDDYKILVITKAGGEGLDLKEVRHVILFEPGWNYSSEEQVVGRAVRYKSHANLPKTERNVKVWKFILLKPGEKLDRSSKGRLFDIDFSRYQSQISYYDSNLKPSHPENESVEKYMFLIAYSKNKEIQCIIEELKKVQIGREK